MEKKLLSIVIPVYNSSAYLSNCLDSIIKAKIPMLELLLIDDGSTDDSLSVCREYSENYSFIKVITREHSGPSAARNAGLDLSAGKYIAFFDSDDYVESDVLHSIVDIIREKDMDIWTFDFCRIADNGCILDKVCQIKETASPIFDSEYINVFLRSGDCVWNVWRYIFSLEFIKRNELRFIDNIDCGEDLELVTRALTKAENIAFYHSPYYMYRVNYGNTLSRAYTAERVRHVTDVFMISADYLLPLNTLTSQLFIKKIAKEYILNLSLYYDIPKKERNDALKYMKRSLYILNCAPSFIYKILNMILHFPGIKLFAYILQLMKKAKRMIRNFKVALYEK